MLGRFPRDLFECDLWVVNFALQPHVIQVGEAGIRHGVAPNLKSRVAQLPHLVA